MPIGQGDVIKSFLVGLGFDVDEGSLRIFNSEIAKAATRVTTLYTAVNAFAGAIVYSFSKISEGFEEMGYQYHIIAPAINKAVVLRHELLKAYSAAGINIRKVIVDSVKLNMSLTKTKYAMEAIYKSVASKFFGLLTSQSETFRKRLYENMPYIINALEKLVKATFTAFKAVTILGGRLWSILSRVYDFFVSLDKATDGWSTIVIGLAAAWRLLNLSFIATPLGALLTGFVALLALFDDFKTWQEGGKSLFDWGPLVEVMHTVYTLAVSIRDVFDDMLSGDWSQMITDFEKVADALGRVLSALDGLIRSTGIGWINKALDWRDNIDQKLGFGSAPAVGSQPSGGGGTINAKMQTDINIVGSANADATARATAQQQQNVNRDMTRNLKGTTR